MIFCFGYRCFCSDCHLLTTQKLFPNFVKRRPLKTAKNCICSENRYIVPLPSLIPEQLLDLSHHDVCILRPLDLHTGEYERQRFGYRQKNGKCHVTWSKLSVEEKINSMPDSENKAKCLRAYNFLMSFNRSSYSSFLRKRQSSLSHNSKINLYEIKDIAGIECTLWPNLYPFTAWCDTVHDGTDTRLSQKVSFLTKVKSCILDYSLSYELLQFNFDLWLFKTVSGAIATARHMKCSPATALDNKIFSSGYWKMQHRLLIDAVEQFGYPDLFITINPYEWSFPFHDIISSARQKTGRGPTELSALETLIYLTFCKNLSVDTFAAPIAINGVITYFLITTQKHKRTSKLTFIVLNFSSAVLSTCIFLYGLRTSKQSSTN